MSRKLYKVGIMFKSERCEECGDYQELIVESDNYSEAERLSEDFLKDKPECKIVSIEHLTPAGVILKDN